MAEVRVYQIAKDQYPSKATSGGRYELGVDYIPEDSERPISVWEGVGYHVHGAQLTPSEALSQQWAEHLHTAGAVWLIPYLERMAAGAAVKPDEILRAYADKNGRVAEFRIWNRQ